MDSGYWLLYRYDPRRLAQKQNPLQLDSKAPTLSYREFAMAQRRFKQLFDWKPQEAEALLQQADRMIQNRYNYYKKLADMSYEDFVV